MQVTETLNEGLKRGYAITVPAAELEAKVTEKLEEARKDFQMKGFRKGKAPGRADEEDVRQVGARRGDAGDRSTRRCATHFEATGDRPALQPEVKMTNEDWQEGQDVEVSMTYEALPQVPEVALAEITLEKLVAEIDDAAVDEALANLAASAKDYEDRKKGAKAKDGDQVVIDFKGSVDGEPFDGGAAEDFPLVLGSGSFIPGFEDQLVGVEGRRRARREGHLPRELRRQAPGRQGGGLRGHREGGEGAEARGDRRRAGHALRRRDARRAQGADPRRGSATNTPRPAARS